MGFYIHPKAYTAAPYDYLSVMHYGQMYPDRPWFTVPPSADIDAKEVGQRTAMSQGDIAQMFHMYCPAEGNGDNQVTGCVNIPGSECGGLDFSSCQNASSDQVKRCCACGGGIKVMCQDRNNCPNVTTSVSGLVDELPFELPFELPEMTASQALTLLLTALCVLLGVMACMCCA